MQIDADRLNKLILFVHIFKKYPTPGLTTSAMNARRNLFYYAFTGSHTALKKSCVNREE